MSGMQLNMNLGMKQELGMRQILAPRMIQSMEILQLPIMALEERIRQELDENPALELKEPTLEELQANEEAPATEEKTPDPDGELVIDDAGELDFNRLEALSQDYGEAFSEEHRPSRNGMEDEGDRKHDAMSNMPSRPQSLNDYLSEQLTFIESAGDLPDLVRYLIANLDENGYLTLAGEKVEPDQILTVLAERYPGRTITAGELDQALRVLQKFDPLGVGARDPQECLLL